MISFTCNICGTANTAQQVPWEPSTCSGCRSNVRMRAIVHLLSAALFGEARGLPDFPVNRKVKGIGLSDENCYALPLAKKFDYTNTFYDHEPFLDITATHPELYGSYDFILSSDVFEHIAPPIERAFAEAFALLKPNGFLCVTVPSAPGDVDTVEYHPDLHAYSIVELGGEHVLINRKRDGSIEVHQNLEFHGGPGATLVMRQFAMRDLEPQLGAAGFSDVTFLAHNVEPNGIFLAGSWAHPLIARKGVFEFPSENIPEPPAAPAADPSLVDALEDRILHLHKDKESLELRIAALESRLRVMFDSRWLKLGKRLGLGPKLR